MNSPECKFALTNSHKFTGDEQMNQGDGLNQQEEGGNGVRVVKSYVASQVSTKIPRNEILSVFIPCPIMFGFSFVLYFCCDIRLLKLDFPYCAYDDE